MTFTRLVKITVLACLAILLTSCSKSDRQVIRYGISPFQDTAMPVVARSMGLYEKQALNVELITIPWEDIVPSLASGGRTIDIGIGSINLLLPRAENINRKGGGDVVFSYPFYVFKGAALMVRKDSGIRPVADFVKLYPSDRNRAIREAMRQIVGKTVGLPKGTPYEQMFMAAFKTADMDYQKATRLRYVKLADALPAFLAGQLDVCGAGVTQRTEAERYGHRVFLQMEDIGFAEIIGLVTTQRFATAHHEELRKLVGIWFTSIDYLMANVDHRSQSVLDYLGANASTKYSVEEYKKALQFQLFPHSEAEARAEFLDPNGRFYWKHTWDIVNDYLITSGQIQEPIPYTYFISQ